MSVKRTRAVTVLKSMKDLRPVPDQTMLKKDIKWDYPHNPTTVSSGNLTNIHQDDESLFVDQTIIVCNTQKLMNSKSDNVKTGDNTAASDDDEFICNIANDLTTLVNTKEPIAILVRLQKIVSIMIKPLTKFRKEKLISKPDNQFEVPRNCRNALRKASLCFESNRNNLIHS